MTNDHEDGIYFTMLFVTYGLRVKQDSLYNEAKAFHAEEQAKWQETMKPAPLESKLRSMC